MSTSDENNWPETLGEALSEALTKKGFSQLTSVQLAVLDPKLQGRDLRITSQTGSGKTLAIGFALREFAARPSQTNNGAAKPHALVIAPTRELAKQVELELSWLYAPLGVRVFSVAGGGSYRDEYRALGAGPTVVVGTPGRLLDHLERKSIDPSNLAAIALDEADRMLDLGFRDDLLAIFGKAPADHLTHLVSATFPREVKTLADRVQKDPAKVEGTPLGEANADIEHVVHLVDPSQRLDAIVNLLLFAPDSNSLVFAKTRADVAQLTRELRTAGFTVSSLSGEMEQPERNRALSMFKRGDLDALVATDVAARGIDVHDIGMVIQAEPPTDSDSYTHRSGRTGRAGKKGTSHLLVDPRWLDRTASLLKRARVRFKIEPIPTPEQIEAATDERFLEEMTAENAAETDSELPDHGFDARTWALAKKLVETTDPVRLVARFVQSARRKAPATPRLVRAIDFKFPEKRGDRRSERNDRTERSGRDARIPEPRPSRSLLARASSTDLAKELPPPRPRAERGPRVEPEGGWVPFHVTWGKEHGADVRRILAMVCRRGDVDGNQIGSIRIDRFHSVVDVARPVAEAFAESTKDIDPRNPRVRISPERAGSGGSREHRGGPRKPGNRGPNRPR
ncbi:MAG TPA: DEAD/DEAH box helicase [Polyangiaceae bacterium]